MICHQSRLLSSLLVAICLINAKQLGRAQDLQPSQKLVAAIDSLVEKNGLDAGEPGVAILIRQPGKLMFQKGYGLANLKTEKPITPQTMFELASVSKTFTATAILILHDRGKLSIEDDFRKHISKFPDFQRNSPIHIRDLLHHTSGLPEYIDLKNVPMQKKTYWINDDYLEVFSRRHSEISLTFATGTKYEYCNTNYMLLASIIERVAQKSFGQFLHDEIFVPAGMEHSFVYESPQAVPENHAPGCIRAVAYEWRKKREVWEPTWGAPPVRNEKLLVVGDGGIWTNLEDMAKWDTALRAGKFLKRETWKLALTPSKTRDGKTFEYGLGWTVYFDKPSEIYGYGHEGAWGGFNNSYYRYLTADRTTVLLSNRGTFDTDKLWTGLDKLVENHLAK